MTNKELKIIKNPKGAGRPKGSGNKITVNSLLNKAADMGMPFEEAILMDWATAPPGSELRYKYNQLLFNKVIADRHQVEVDDSSTMENRQVAFLKALEVIGGVAIAQDNQITIDPGPMPLPISKTDD